jgi:hypothetical protein
MIKQELPISIHRLAMLQAYLYEIFSTEKKEEILIKLNVI